MKLSIQVTTKLFSVARIPRDLSRGWMAGVRRSSLERRRIGLWRISRDTTAFRPLSASFCFVSIFSFFTLNYARLSITQDDLVVSFGGKFKEEAFFAKNTNLLNNANEMDKIWYAQQTLDLDMHALYGKEKYGHDALELKLNFRNKGRWGSATSIATTTYSSTKVADFVTPGHRHFIGKFVIWLREGWLKLSLSALLNREIDTRHFIMFGSFPFALGRGIALGDAFAVNPGNLGFYTDDVVDQYAFGVRMFGDIVKDKLTYDLYASVLETEADSFRKTTEKIRTQYLGDCEFSPGRIDPFRGPGDVNYIVAGRLLWVAMDSPRYGKIVVEPYALYNRDPEQRVEVEPDANSKLATAGMSVEWAGSRFEGGFETAFNMGRQRVVALDRNRIDLKNINGIPTLVYTKVVTDLNNSSSNAVVTSANKTTINNASQNISENGQEIAHSGLYNASDRFRAGYKNKYRGWMVVADAAYWLKQDVLSLAATVAVASGDESPNRNLDDPKDAVVDGEFKGFIPLQEVYSGKRVQSTLVGAGRVPRPLSVPRADHVVSNRFALTDSGFTNLIFTGCAANWLTDTNSRWHFQPNILWFWQEHATKAFSLAQKASLDCYASRFLGTEANIFIDWMMFKTVKGFMILSGFFPGQHYKDIQGKPLSSEQSSFVDRLDPTGFANDPEPLLGHDKVFTLNAGLEYKF